MADHDIRPRRPVSRGRKAARRIQQRVADPGDLVPGRRLIPAPVRDDNRQSAGLLPPRAEKEEHGEDS